MSFVLLDRKWGQPVFATASGPVTWGVTSFGGLSFDETEYSISDFEEALNSAFRTWENAAGIDFQFTFLSETANISLTMASLPGPTIGRAATSFFPLPGTDQMASAQVQFDSQETWSPYGQTALNFFAVAVHEIGHVLGLDHINDPSQIMNPVVYLSRLGDGDLAGIRLIYGPRTAEGQAENLAGSFADDFLFGEGGEDTLIGAGGDDRLFGGADSDNLQGGNGHDILLGENGNSRDGFAAQTFRLYGVALNRDPDGPGHDYWTNALNAGTSYTAVAKAIVASDEFRNNYGILDNESFAEALYYDALGRAPDSTGLAYWTQSLNSGLPRYAVVAAFAESSEFINLTESTSAAFTTASRQRDFSDEVFRFYDGLLDRAPDVGGLLHWTENLVSGGSASTVITAIMGSAEYQSQFGSLSNEDFVSGLYQSTLDRVGSASEVSWWVSALSNGFSRSQVAEVFTESAEAQSKSQPKIEAYFSGGEVSGLDDILQGGNGNDLLIGGLGADTFVFDAAEAGADVVADLDPWDTVQMDGFSFSDLSDVPWLLRQEGEDVVFEDGGLKITFLDTFLADLA